MAIAPEARDYLSQISRNPVRFTLVAGTEGQPAVAFQNRGVFTRFLEQGIRGAADSNGDGLVTSNELQAYVQPRVADRVSQLRLEQLPQYGRVGTGEFIFFLDAGGGCGPGQHLSSGHCCGEGEEWVQARNRCWCLDQAVCGPPPPTPPVAQAPARPRPPTRPPAGSASEAPPRGWVRIEPGTFLMGSPNGEVGRDTDETQHRVTLTRPFLLMEAEVTQAQFREVMGRNPSHFTKCGSSCPVEQVSWHEAAAYCNALSERAGREKCYTCTGTGTSVSCDPSKTYSAPYDCRGYRLPTEAEWEHAARAGSTEARYGVVDEVGWYWSNSGSTTHPVKSKRRNAWGLYDMLGNVWEWNHDWYQQNLGGAAVTDPSGPPSGQYRALRGGGWSGDATRLRAAYRDGVQPGDRSWSFGFRVAVSAASTVE